MSAGILLSSSKLSAAKKRPERENKQAGKMSTGIEPGLPDSMVLVTAVSDTWTYSSSIEVTRCPYASLRIRLAVYLMSLLEMSQSVSFMQLIIAPPDVTPKGVGVCRHPLKKYGSLVFS